MSRKSYSSLPLTEEQIEEEEEMRREQEHDAEYDYVDMHSKNIKGRDGALIKKTATISKEEQQKIQKEQYRLKQLKIQKKKEEQQQREWEQRMQMDKEMIYNNTKNIDAFAQENPVSLNNAENCDWEDLY